MNQPEPIPQQEPELPEFEQHQLDQLLTHAMRPVDPPAGFAARTLARIDPPSTPSTRVLRMKIFHHQRLWASGALAATVLTGAVFTQQAHIRRERQRRKADLAAQQFEAAMRITGDTLEQVRLQIQQSGIQIGN